MDISIDITKLTGVCVYCEKVIFKSGLAASGIRTAVTKHLFICPKSPYHSIEPIKYLDDERLNHEL